LRSASSRRAQASAHIQDFLRFEYMHSNCGHLR
jgi:hypothetical protein